MAFVTFVIQPRIERSWTENYYFYLFDYLIFICTLKGEQSYRQAVRGTISKNVTVFDAKELVQRWIAGLYIQKEVVWLSTTDNFNVSAAGLIIF